MKYWRGYLVAAILAVAAWALTQFAATYAVFVDMIYPYMTRLIQDGLATWSSGTALCLWQLGLLLMVVGVLATAVLMIVFKWNPIQWFGWVLAAVSVLFLLNTGIYGLNAYAGDLSVDIHLQVMDPNATQMEKATTYFRDKANELAQSLERDAEGNLVYPSLEELAEEAGQGFEVLVYEEFMAVFAGSRLPVKELQWSDWYTSQGMTGITVALTGESAVNPQVPAVGQPFAICHEMAHRMCVANDRDANLAAYLACLHHPSEKFQYSAYLAAFRYCFNMLQTSTTSTGRAAVQRVKSGMTDLLKQDLEVYGSFFEGHEDPAMDSQVSKLLISWYIQEIALPPVVDEDDKFDPMDESQVDLPGLS